MLSAEDKELIRGWAHQGGFDYAAFARLGASEHEKAFGRWIERGDQAGMAYLERRVEERADPRKLVEGAESVLCVGLRYFPLEGESAIEGDLWPRVARYARGDDYHDVMNRRLSNLADRLEGAYPGLPLRSYVDTGPVLERELAARAGIGAIGKNTNLLNPDHGSWLLLGEVFLSRSLESDPTVADLCGSCTRCLEACPTGALPEPYRLDSRECISYWTIEHRGAIPSGMRAKLGDWVFGCDICQEVCPLNDHAGPVEHREFEMPKERKQLDLIGLLLLETEDYSRLFRGSPMKRAKRGGLRRNAAVTMGNLGNPKYLPALELALGSEDAIVRGHAAWSIGRIGGAEARRILTSHQPHETDPGVRLEVESALAENSDGTWE